MAEKATSQTFMVDDDYTANDLKFRSSFSKKQTTYAISIAIVIAVILLIIGIVLIAKSNKSCDDGASTGSATGGQGASTTTPSSGITTSAPPTTATTTPPEDACEYSAEAQRIDLNGTLRAIRDAYFTVFANDAASHPEYLTKESVRVHYRSYNHTPAAIKHRTDLAARLLAQINNKTIDTDLLKPREHKALLQAKHYLMFTFGMPYEGNYYGGDWMLGPNSFCWQPMCSIGYDIRYGIGNMDVNSKWEIENVLRHFRETNDTIHQYIANMRLGIKTGMIRTKVECQGGLDAMKAAFPQVSGDNNATAILSAWQTTYIQSQEFVSNLTEAITHDWKASTGKFPNETLKDAIVDYLGKPLKELLRYLEFDHALHCRPDNVGPGGLSGLPIDVIYFNGTAQPGSTTTKTLPIMENGAYPKINGNDSYTKILGYFTTKDFTPDDVHQLGWEQLKILYPQVIEIAKTTTSNSDETEAVASFRKILVNNTVSFFNKEPLPENETTGDAFVKCTSVEGAKKYCPNRWAAMEAWFKFSRSVMSLLDPKTVNMFYFTGDKHTTPNCPVTLKPDFNPSSAAQSYNGADIDCTRNAEYNLPFFLRNLGPVYSEYSVNAHEARPGHHTQVQGNTEHFKDQCGGLPRWLDDQTYYTAFTEGWALYAENPLIAIDTDTYTENLMQKYGMLKWQIWRAIRLIVDTGLHYKGFSRQDCLDLFAKYAWDTSDLAEKEVLRYQSNPGQATAYMIGQLDIKRFRNYTATELGDDFSLKEFHYQALSQGSSPLSFLESHTKKYVACKKDPAKSGCGLILNAPQRRRTDSVAKDLLHRPIKLPRRQYF